MQDKQENLKEYYEKKEFYQKFSQNLIVVDPIDREGPALVDATKVEELIDLVKKTQSFSGNRRHHCAKLTGQARWTFQIASLTGTRTSFSKGGDLL